MLFDVVFCISPGQTTEHSNIRIVAWFREKRRKKKITLDEDAFLIIPEGGIALQNHRSTDSNENGLSIHCKDRGGDLID